MITFERLTLDTDFEVWDILHHDIKIGYIRKDNWYTLELFYTPYRLRLNQRQFIMPITRLMCSFSDLKAMSGHYVPNENLKPLERRLTDYKEYTIKD